MSTQESLYFEDFELGRGFRTAGRTITEADVVSFAGLSGDFSSLHLDETFAAASPYGRRIAHGLCGVTVFSGLFVRLGLWDKTAVAFLSTSWQFKAPVFLNDTLTGVITVGARRLTSRGDRGIVTFKVDLENQSGEIVQTGDWVQMFLARGSGQHSDEGGKEDA
jgi:acyl dehydratase